MDERISDDTPDIINLHFLTNNEPTTVNLMETDTEGSGVLDLMLTEPRNKINEHNITFSFDEYTTITSSDLESIIFNANSNRSNLTNSTTTKSLERSNLKNFTSDHKLLQKSKYAVVGAVLGGIAAAIAVGSIAAAVAVAAAGIEEPAGEENIERVGPDVTTERTSKNLI